MQGVVTNQALFIWHTMTSGTQELRLGLRPLLLETFSNALIPSLKDVKAPSGHVGSWLPCKQDKT